MAKVKHLDSEAVRLAFLQNDGNASVTAAQFDVSRQTVHHHLKAASPVVVEKVNLTGLDPTVPLHKAVADYVRACLDRAGILKERPADNGDRPTPSRSP